MFMSGAVVILVILSEITSGFAASVSHSIAPAMQKVAEAGVLRSTGNGFPVTFHDPGSDAEKETRKVILQLALESLQQLYSPTKYRISLSARWIPARILETAPDEISTVEPKGAVKQYTNFEIVYQSGDRLQKAEIQLSVSMDRRLPVLSRRMFSGEKLKAEDLDLRWVPVPFNGNQPFATIDQIAGKTLRRTLEAGQAVYSTNVGSAYLINAGDKVKVVFNNYGILIEIAAEARESGGKDDLIRVYSTETRERYLGKVISSGVTKWIQTL
jgi:flagella basal body P-ring formation protein FlgA